MTEEKPSRFDESAALAEIERLQQALLVARKARTDKSEEFDRFIRSFRTPASPRPSADDVPRQPPAVIPDDATASSLGALPAAEAAPARPPQTAVRRPWRLGIVAVATVVTLVVIALAIPRDRAGTPSPPPPAAAKVPSAEKPAPPPSLPQPASAPEARAAVQLELRTLAQVWIRVVVDGDKKVEDVIPAGQRLSFSATKSIVVRAGNGGDLVVVTENREERFGAADQPLTRTFAPSGAQNPPRR